ncbi:unnamed protein product [Rhizoctonia solani]|uniref:Uncharacterized protein n=1 Tax=Rhizoctonia solani TaxID=456999 RepID=A0A8H2X4Z7_9AGAM|nr:unnamed protein product [Rhizoctonia solani]
MAARRVWDQADEEDRKADMKASRLPDDYSATVHMSPSGLHGAHAVGWIVRSHAVFNTMISTYIITPAFLPHNST